MLRKLRGDHATRVFIFRGEPIVQDSTLAWRKALERAGIADFRWHDLRHTFATGTGRPALRLMSYSNLAVWKTGAMVERYAHVASKALQGAAARLDAMTGYVAATPEASPESPTA